jgi:outer membrane protein
VDRYAEKNAKMKAEIARVQLLENNKSVLNAYKKLYFQWLLNMKILDEIKESIKNSKVQRDQISANTRAGLSEEDDYQRTVATVMAYENQYTEYLTSLRNIENQLSLYIDISAVMPDQGAFTQYHKTSSAYNFDFISFEKTNSYRIVDLTLKNLDYSRGVYENKLLPILNAFASITKKDITDYSSDAYSKVPGYKVGIEFTYKLGNNAAESDLEDVKLQIQSIKYEYDKTHNDYKKNLLKLQEYARSAIKEIKTTTAILDSLRLRLITEKRKYGQGRLALSYIIDTKNSIASYNISLLNLKYQLISYYLDYKDLTE